MLSTSEKNGGIHGSIFQVEHIKQVPGTHSCHFSYFAFIVACYDLHGVSFPHMDRHPLYSFIFREFVVLPLLPWTLKLAEDA